MVMAVGVASHPLFWGYFSLLLWNKRDNKCSLLFLTFLLGRIKSWQPTSIPNIFFAILLILEILTGAWEPLDRRLRGRILRRERPAQSGRCPSGGGVTTGPRMASVLWGMFLKAKLCLLWIVYTVLVTIRSNTQPHHFEAFKLRNTFKGKMILYYLLGNWESVIILPEKCFHMIYLCIIDSTLPTEKSLSSFSDVWSPLTRPLCLPSPVHSCLS